jgi:hypothetical protein
MSGRGATFRFSLSTDQQSAEQWMMRSMNLHSPGK